MASIAIIVVVRCFDFLCYSSFIIDGASMLIRLAKASKPTQCSKMIFSKKICTAQR